MTKYYIVWMPGKREGIIVADKGVAYEAHKGAESNCFDVDGNQSKLAQYFCELTLDFGYCETQEIELKDTPK